jgi:hypothetical protein
MQRITWSGVAMHAGVLPGYPASHGCIRMPANFAVRMYGWTKQGARVVITPGELSPTDFSHPLLFTRKPDPAADAPKDAQKDLVSTPKSDKATADNAAANAKAVEGEKIELRPAQPSGSADQVRTADASGAVPQKIDDAKDNIEPKKDKDQTRQSEGDKPVTVALADAAKPDTSKSDSGKSDKSSDKTAIAPKPRTGHISAYISRKEGKLFVRQNFEPLFDVRSARTYSPWSPTRTTHRRITGRWCRFLRVMRPSRRARRKAPSLSPRHQACRPPRHRKPSTG